MLATLKALGKRIADQSHDDMNIQGGILQQLSRSILSIIGMFMLEMNSIHYHHILNSYLLLTLYTQNMFREVNGPFHQRIRHNNTNTSAPGIPETPYHAFLAGAVGGYTIWGRYSGVNYQLILYLTSRILVGCIKLASEKGIPPFSWKALSFHKTYPWAAAGVWGTVMMLFEEHPDVLHPSLRRSMDEIYRFASFGGTEKQQPRA